MSPTFFAARSAEVAEHCHLARDGLYRIQEYLIEPVDRVEIARDCLKHITAAVRIRRNFGPRRVRGAAEELNKSLELAVRTIERLMAYREDRSELERPIELETAEILVDLIGVVVGAGTLRMTRLKTLSRTCFDLKERAWSLFQKAGQADDREFGHINDAFRSNVQHKALGLEYRADTTHSEITTKIHQLRRCRRPRSI